MWIYELMAIMGTYSNRSMDYDIVLWTYSNASLNNDIVAIIISTLLCFSHVSMLQCVRVIYFSSVHYVKHITCLTIHYQQHISNMLYFILKVYIILLYCYFTKLCCNLINCNFNFVMKLIRVDIYYNLLGMHFEVVLIKSANHRHPHSIQVSSKCTKHLHVPSHLIMSHYRCPFKYFENIYVKLWFMIITLVKTNYVIIVIIYMIKHLNIIANGIHFINLFIFLDEICVIPRYLMFSKYIILTNDKNYIYSVNVYLYDKYIILILALSKKNQCFTIPSYHCAFTILLI